MKLSTVITRHLYSVDLGLVLTRARFTCYIDTRKPWRDTLDMESIKLVDLPHVPESAIPESFCDSMIEKALESDLNDWDEVQCGN